MAHRPTILFVDGLWVEKHGIMALIPHLEREGFCVHLRLTRNIRRLLAFVADLQPDVVAFSVTTGWHERALLMARAVRDRFPGVRTLFGGPHVTYFPDVVLDPAVDYAFVGECDRELAPGLTALLQGAPPDGIPNLARRIDGPGGPEVALGPLAPLADDLDALPLPDRDHYCSHRFFRHSPYKSFIVSRGCPHDCAFCFNRKLRTMYRGKGRFLRYRSPESVVDEALAVRQRFGMKLASFEDDLLTCDRRWLEKLLPLWRSRVAIPYNLNATAEALTDESLVRLLRETGIWCVAFGVETGDEGLRRTLLNKSLGNDQVRRAGALLRKHGVRFLTYNMFVLPGERLEDAMATIHLNREIGTRLARCTLFTPYPGTELGDRLSRNPAGGEMLFSRSSAVSPEAARIERLQKLALLGMRSGAAERLVRLASALPAGPVHDLVFWTTYFAAVRDYMRTGTLHLLELGIRSMTDWA
jgi:radical SAM superfamily enzyme YgiQ (UPF0313 family)